MNILFLLLKRLEKKLLVWNPNTTIMNGFFILFFKSNILYILHSGNNLDSKWSARVAFVCIYIQTNATRNLMSRLLPQPRIVLHTWVSWRSENYFHPRVIGCPNGVPICTLCTLNQSYELSALESQWRDAKFGKTLVHQIQNEVFKKFDVTFNPFLWYSANNMDTRYYYVWPKMGSAYEGWCPWPAMTG